MRMLLLCLRCYFDATSWSFEQQRELLLLQMELSIKHRVEVDKELTLEKIKCGTEQTRITLVREKLSLIRDGSLSLEASQGLGGDFSSGAGSSSHYDLICGLFQSSMTGSLKHFFLCLKGWLTQGTGLMPIAPSCRRYIQLQLIASSLGMAGRRINSFHAIC